MTEEDDQKQKEEAERKATEERAAKEKAEAAKGNGDGISGEEKLSKLDIMTKGNEAMKKTLDERETLLKRHEEIEERERVSGKANAGEIQEKPKTEDEKWAEGAKERYAGTGLDPTPDDSPTTFS